MTVGEVPALDTADSIEEDFERARRREPRVELPQAAGSGIAGIDENLLPLPRGPLVHGREAGQRQEHFAARLEQRRPAASVETQRHGADRPHVVSDVLAGRSIAARGRLLQHPVTPGDADGDAIELRLACVVDLLLGLEPLPHPPVKSLDLLARKGIFERQHRYLVTDRREPGHWRTADSLCRRVRRHQVPVMVFQRAQLAYESVVFGIRYFRVVEYVVAVIVTRDFGPQPIHPPPRACRCRHRQVRRSRRFLCSKWTRSSRRLRIRCAVSVLPCSS